MIRPFAAAWLSLSFAAATVSAAEYRVPLVANGEPAATIVLPESPDPTLTLAADELIEYVGRISGAKLTVGGRAAARIAIEIAPAGLPTEDSFRIVTAPGEIRLIGGGPLGALYAAYALLEDLGVRWLVPGDDGALVPRRASVDYPATDRIETPSFRCRFFYVHGAEAQKWAVRNRLNGFFDAEFARSHGNAYYLPPVVSSIHSFADILPPDKYFADHPEFYALVKGKRVRPTILQNQICTSNPQVVEIIAKAVREYFLQTPGARVFSIAPNDGYGWCECPACKALDEKLCANKRWYYRDDQPVVSDRLCQFANEVARRALDDLPGRELYMFAYVSYCEPPQTVRPDPRVTHVVCHYIPACYAHPIAAPGCPDNERYDGYLKGWAAVAPQAMVYAYTDKSQWVDLPRPVVRPMAADVRHYYELGLRKYLAQSGAVAWPGAGPLYYVTAKLLWNAGRQPDEIIRQWNEAMYGPAAPAMAAWYDEMEKAVARTGGHYGGDPLAEAANVYTPGGFEAAAARLDEALRAADNAAARSRITRVKAHFDNARLGAEAIAGNARWEQTGDRRALAAARQAAAALLKQRRDWGGTSLEHFKQYLEGIATVSADGVRWQGWGRPEEKGGRTCRNADETGPGDNAAGWASFSVIVDDPRKTYRVEMDVWGQSQVSSLLICTWGRGKGTGAGGVWKPLPREGQLSGRPEWCTLRFSVAPAMLDPDTRRQVFGLGGADSQMWAADIRFQPTTP